MRLSLPSAIAAILLFGLVRASLAQEAGPRPA